MIKSVFDEKILNGGFLKDRKFQLDAYEDAVRPIIDSVFDGDEVDTSGMTKHALFRMAVSIAKKREGYTPVQKTKKKKVSASKVTLSTLTLSLTLLNTKNNLKSICKIRPH